MSDPLRLIPEDLRANASDLAALGKQARQMQDTLTHTWSRLDSAPRAASRAATAKP